PINNRPETGKASRRPLHTAAGWFALMLRSIAARRERRRFHSPSALRCVSKHEGHAAAVLILRDARTRVRLCGSACACALLRMRTSIAFQSSSRCQTAQIFSFPRRTCARGFASLLHSPRVEGWAERRETFWCSGTRGARHDAAYQAPSEAPCVP